MICETAENRQPLVDAATSLVEFSLHDKGCISYDFYQSQTNDDRYMIVETWASEEALKAHTETDHYRRFSPELHAHATVTLEKFTF